jgi:Flp pilus assembly protein TadG
MLPRVGLSFLAADRHETNGAPVPQRIRPARSEDGVTLVELLIVMPFLLIVTGLVMNTLTTAYGAESRVQATSQSSAQVTLAFEALDTEMRYASDVETGQDQTTNPTNYYVWFDSDWNSNSQGAPLCTELDYNNSSGILQQHSWYTGGTVPSGWQALATGLETSDPTSPFTLHDESSPWWLQITLSSEVVSGSSTGNAQSSFTVTALNTTVNSSNTGVCGGP